MTDKGVDMRIGSTIARDWGGRELVAVRMQRFERIVTADPGQRHHAASTARRRRPCRPPTTRRQRADAVDDRCGVANDGAATAPSTTPAGAVDPNAPEVVEPGDIPDNQVFIPFAHADGIYTVKVPEGWARTEAGGVVTFTDNYNSIALQSSAAATAPTVDTVSASGLVRRRVRSDVHTDRRPAGHPHGRDRRARHLRDR